MENPKNYKIYQCINCDIVTRNKKDYEKHLLTLKHIYASDILIEANENPQNDKVNNKICHCGKSYKHMSSLCKHKNYCKQISSDEIEESNISLKKSTLLETDNLALLLIETVKHNQELQKQSYEYQQQNQEFQHKMFEMISDKIGTQNTMINSNNNTTNNTKFNLQFFLNETCKDAMNINEFIDSIKVSFEDVEYSGMHGFTEGMSRIFLRELNKLDVCKRPIHCTDLKREVFHIKGENNSWENERSLIFKIINLITRKNMFILKDWSEANPLCMNTQTKIHDRFVKLKIACFGPYDNEVEKKEFNKIIAKVAKATAINKKTGN